MTDRPRSITIVRGSEQGYAWERQTDDDPHTGDFGLCPFCRQPLGEVPTETHPYFGIEIDLDPNSKAPDAAYIYECLGEERKGQWEKNS
jgi:hypothetical protein